MKLNCLLVDDEPLALELLEDYTLRVPYLQLMGKASDAFQALELLQLSSSNIDLMFLDVHMPDLTGIEMLKTLASPPAVVFTTAHPDYALAGFELNAIDYLLKPISFERFLKAANKAHELIQNKTHGLVQAQQANPNDMMGYLFIKSDTHLLKVYLQDILLIEGLGDYVKIHTRGKTIVTLQTLKNLAVKLPAERFIRVHRSFIVALDKIDSINGQTIYIGTHQVPIGNLYRDVFFELVNQRNL